MTPLFCHLLLLVIPICECLHCFWRLFFLMQMLPERGSTRLCHMFAFRGIFLDMIQILVIVFMVWCDIFFSPLVVCKYNFPLMWPLFLCCADKQDADLIMLALATHEVHFSILREVHFLPFFGAKQYFKGAWSHSLLDFDVLVCWLESFMLLKLY